MKKVLFVDDESNVLEGLQRMLRTMREEWTMEFAASGPDALRALAGGAFDVVVSDMRMPGMDGAQLLSEVRKLYPKTVRIVLSGQSDHELIMKTVGPAHQYLSKPCSADELKSTVRRACALRDLLADPTLQRLVSRMQSLPSLPVLYSKLMEEVNSTDSSIKKVGEIISQDPAMTAKILQLINSAFFGLRRCISNPAEATALLGLDTVTALVLSAQVFVQFNNSRLPEFSMEEIWTHSSKVAALARAIAKTMNAKSEVVEQSFAAGMLHEIGSLILAATLPVLYSDVLLLADAEGLSIYEAERSVFGAGHPEVGAYLLGIWGLPDSVVEAIAFHATPGRTSDREFGALTALHLANHFETIGSTAFAAHLDTNYLKEVGMFDRIEEISNLQKVMAAS